MVAPPVEVEKVNHLSQAQEVEEITQGPGQDEAVAHGWPPAVPGQAPPKIAHHRRHQAAEGDEKYPGELHRQLSQHTEGRPPVVDVHQVEEAFNHGNLRPQRQELLDQNLAPLVQGQAQHQDDEKDDELSGHIYSGFLKSLLTVVFDFSVLSYT